MGLASKLKAQQGTSNNNVPLPAGPVQPSQQQSYYNAPPPSNGPGTGLLYPSAPPANSYQPPPFAPPSTYDQQQYGQPPGQYQQQSSYPPVKGPQGPPPDYSSQAPPGINNYSQPYPGQIQPPYSNANQPYGTVPSPYPGLQGQLPYGGPAAPYQPRSSSNQPFASAIPYTPPNMAALENKLRQIIQQNRLEAFYGNPQAFQNVLAKAQRVNFDAIAAQWRISKELSYDLVSLVLYDIVFFCDDSGSMAFEENGERIDDLKEILGQVSSIATQFDDDGVLVRFINSNTEGSGIRSSAEVASLISQINFTGGTNIGASLDHKVLQPLVIGPARSGTIAKPILVVIITDGEPSDNPRHKIAQVISQAKAMLNQTRYGAGAVAFEIAQVGRDAKAQKFLESLDTHKDIGNMVDCTSYYELESEEYSRKGITLTPELWLLKLCCGGIDRSYDDADE